MQLGLAKIRAEDEAADKEQAMPVYGSQVCFHDPTDCV